MSFLQKEGPNPRFTFDNQSRRQITGSMIWPSTTLPANILFDQLVNLENFLN
jgi:hypothetical protein